MSDERTALYLFCFARPGLVRDELGLGIDGQSPVFIQSFPAACAVLSEIATGELCGPGAAERLSDLTWVGVRACRHEEIIEKVLAVSPVFPAPFATLFTSPGSLRRFMDREARTISHFLNLVTDKEEWAVRGLADMATLRQCVIVREMAAREAQLASLSPGSRYLQERRIQTEADRTVRDWLSTFCQETRKELQQHAVAFAERHLWNAGKEFKSVVNWAFLLPKDRVAGFQAQLESINKRLQQAGLTFTLSGPWPPYSFAPKLPIEAHPTSSEPEG